MPRSVRSLRSGWGCRRRIDLLHHQALLWAMLLGYLVFGDVPDTMMVLGASIIVASGLYAFYRERIRHREVTASATGLPPDGL